MLAVLDCHCGNASLRRKVLARDLRQTRHVNQLCSARREAGTDARTLLLNKAGAPRSRHVRLGSQADIPPGSTPCCDPLKRAVFSGVSDSWPFRADQVDS